METPINLILLGDQTVEKLSSIQALVQRSKTSAAARRLLQGATDAVQLNFERLSKEERAWNHEISSLLGLAEDNIAEEKPNGIIATVLMLIGRLGELVVHAEEDSSILGSENDVVHILAYCTGLLPGAALAAARDTNELYEIGVELISITFRMIREITTRMMLIEETYESWAYSIVGKTSEQVQPILDAFHREFRIPYAKRVAVGVVSTGWLTLMGAPSSVALLMKFSKELDEAPKVKTDTNGAVHTEYIPTFDVDAVLGNSPLLEIPITSKAKMLSPATCKQYSHNTLRSLLSEIMVDIAHKILNISGTAEALVSDFVGKKPVLMTVAGPTGHLTAVQRILQKKGVDFRIREHEKSKIKGLSRGGSDLIAVVGMSGRFPGSETIEGFFEDLLESKIQIKKIPKSRFDLDTFYDPSGTKRNTTSTQWGAFMDKPGYFDNRLFNISPREALSMDPLQRLLLTTSYEALEMAGYSKDATLSTDSNRIAVYYGQAAEDWSEVMNEAGIDLYYIPGMNRAFGPSRISYHHKWGGGTYALDAACASSSTAIHLACSALKARECDTALAGGGSLLVTPNLFAGLSRSGMISDNGGCRTFHDDADGYCRGEGVGVVVLKRLEDALADNDNILGVICGSARAYSNTSTSITHPSAEAQARIYVDVLRQMSVVPNEIAYVEMHGTGTQAGDFEEMNSVIQILGKGRSKENVLTVGAVKANVAHGEGVAGVTSLIKVLMMLRERRIPPQPGLPLKLNHKFPKLDKLNIRIAGMSGKNLMLQPSPASANGKLKCLVNTFDASGGNTSLLIEEAPQRSSKRTNPLPAHVVVLSGHSKTSLTGNRLRLLDYLTRNPDVKLADLAYTTTARRMHERLRVAYTAKSTKEVMKQLHNDISTGAPNDPKSKMSPTKLVMTFTGQGSQYAGMGAQLYEHSATLRDLLHTYQHLAEHSGLPRFLHLISSRETDIRKESPVVVQLAVIALEIATANLLKSWGICPDVVMGHSLGEYSALCIAGVLSVNDTLNLVGQRARLIESQLTADEYSMLAIGKSEGYVHNLLSNSSASKTAIACLNAPELTVISGPVSEVELLKTRLEGQGVRTTMVSVAYGFHSQQIEPVLDEFEKLASAVVFSPPAIPIISTLSGKVIEKGQSGIFSSSYLTRQARERVNFVGALHSFKSYEAVYAQSCFVEIGPEPVCLGLIRRTLELSPTKLLPIMKSSEDNWVTLSTTLASLHEQRGSINWPQFFKEFKDTVSLLDLPTYFFDEKDFWVPYVKHLDFDAGASKTMHAVEAESRPAQPISTFRTTTLQRVENESIDDTTVTVIFGSYTAEPSLYKAIRGHIVNGIHICSLSIFTDMAKSAAHYAYTKAKQNSKVPTMSIFDVALTHALVVSRPDPTQIIKTTVTYSPATNIAQVSFNSQSDEKNVEHGSIKLAFEESSDYFSRMYNTKFLIDTRIQALKEAALTGKAHRMLKPVFYKLFKNLVSYDEPYQALDEICVDSQCRDAVGTLVMPDTSNSGNFMYNPFWMDAGVQVSGFLLNSGLKFPEDITCLATGFESWKLVEEFEAGRVYTSYVSMQDTETPNIILGDAYVFNDQNTLIQVTTGIRFMKMKRTTLNAVLNPSVGGTSAHKPSNASGSSRRVSDMSTLPQVSPVASNAFHNLPSVAFSQPANHTMLNTPGYNERSDDSASEPSNDGASTPATSVGEMSNLDYSSTLFSIIAQESGCGTDELEDSTSVADIGMDSLMAITVVSAFLRSTGVELPATFFLENETLGSAKAALSEMPEIRKSAALREQKPLPATIPALQPECMPPESHLTQSQPVTASSSEPPTFAPKCMDEAPSDSPTSVIKPSFPSKAVLLQGSPSSSGIKVFFFPDGSGSLSRYIQIPAFGKDVNLIGLDSPFLKTPDGYTCSVEEVADSFITAMMTVQPSGPYHLGGFSFGAIYAYEVAQKLTQIGHKVEALFIIDMAVPTHAEIRSCPSHDELKNSGLIQTTGRQTAMQKDHLARTVRAMMDYKFIPFSSSSQPTKTALISSRSGLAAGKETPLAKWVQGVSKTARGWQDLVGPVQETIIDANHFDLLRHPNVKQVGQACIDTLAQLSSS